MDEAKVDKAPACTVVVDKDEDEARTAPACTVVVDEDEARSSTTKCSMDVPLLFLSYGKLGRFFYETLERNRKNNVLPPHFRSDVENCPHI